MLRHDEALRSDFLKTADRALFNRCDPFISAELAAELERAAAMSQAYDDMLAAAGKVDGSFDVAKARFDGLAERDEKIAA